jgi:3-phenylpropionate/trans-cinnamate dioxygenase ferredoxin subunit
MELKYVKVAALEEVPPGKTARVTLQPGEHVLVCNVGGSIYAVRDMCTHKGGILGFGDLDGGVIECPRHGARFDVATGKVVAPPATAPIRTYPVRVQDGQIEVGLDT